MFHFSRVFFSSFLLLSFFLFFNTAEAQAPITPNPPAFTEAKCLAMQGRCADSCDDADGPSPGDCITSTPGTPLSGSGICCVRKDAVAATGKSIGEIQCLAKGGTCSKNCGITDDISNGACTGGATTSGTFCCIAKGAVPTFGINTKAACEQRKGACRPRQFLKSNCNGNEVQGGNCDDAPGNTICCISSSFASSGANTNNSSNANSNANNTPPADLNYTLLEKIPGVDSRNLNFSSYLSAIYKLAIWIVGLCALFMFLVGAFMYMLSAANTSKMGSAKDIMQDALIGLVLALTSYLLLYVINPDLVNLRLPSTTPGTTTGAGTGTGAGAAAGTSAVKNPGAAWPDDSPVRTELSSSGIAFNRGNCKTEGDKEFRCTSVAELGRPAIDGLKALKAACTSCGSNDIMVNGGTEYWFHSPTTKHQRGASVVDLNMTAPLLNFLKTSGTKCDELKGGDIYRWNGSDYWAEDANHFHVSFGGKICK